MTKETDVSVWLLPKKDQEAQLQSEIDRLAKSYQATSFLPHLTLFYSDTQLPLVEVRAAVEQIAQQYQPIETLAQGVEYSKTFTQTLFVRYDLTAELGEMLSAMNQVFDDFEFSLTPHLSLLYSRKITEEEKKEEVQTVTYPSELHLDRLAVITKPGGTIATEADVRLWQVDSVFDLS